MSVISRSASVGEGKYEILSVGLTGGMGEVFKVRHRLLGEIRAIKVMRTRAALDPQRQERFLREARMVARLRHPNLAQLFDLAFHENGTAYMVLEWIEGADLAKLLRAAGPPPVGDTLEIAKQALDCLAFLHSEHIVHRDISTDNLMATLQRDDRFQLKLIDLGIAKKVDGGDDLTKQGLFVGKLRYSPPEAFDGKTKRSSPDPRSDLYSFGVVLYELLTGTSPIAGSSDSELVAGHLFRPPRPFAETDPHQRIPQPLREIVLKALEKKLEDRIQTAGEFSEALTSVASKVNLGLAPERTPLSQSLGRFKADGRSPEELPTLDLSDAGAELAPPQLDDSPEGAHRVAGIEKRQRELNQTLRPDSQDWSHAADRPKRTAGSEEKEAWFDALRDRHRRRGRESSVVSSVVRVVRDHPKIMLSAALGALLLVLVSFSGVLASSDEASPPPDEAQIAEPAAKVRGETLAATDSDQEPPPTFQPEAARPANTAPPSVAVISDSAELTSEVLQRLSPAVSVLFPQDLRAAMADDGSGNGPRLVVQLSARLGNSPVEAYDTLLAVCEAVTSAHALAVPSARSLYSRTIRRTAPHCGEATALAGRQLAQELVPKIEALLREMP